jgi:mannose-6-phosphate isomerase-like protein (cupin superfamily)
MKARIMYNPITGEQIAFVKTSEETRGEYLEFIQTLPRRGSGFLKEHIHADHEERFEVLEGVAVYSIKGISGTARVGDKIVIPINTAHINPYNEHDEALVLKRMSVPAVATELYYRKMFELANSGRLNAAGKASIIQLAVMAEEFGSQTYYTALPKRITTIATFVLGKLGLMLGYKAMLKEN